MAGRYIFTDNLVRGIGTVLLAPTLALSLGACTPSPGNDPGAGDTGAFNEKLGVGTVDGGGGKGVLCENPSRLMTLDLWEAENSHFFTLQGPEATLEKNVVKFGLSLFEHMTVPGDIKPEDEKQVRELVATEFQKRLRPIPRGRRLPHTQDATVSQLPRDCHVVQIAVFTRDGRILLDEEYWDRLSLNDKTALVLHEILYMAARESSNTSNSDEVRWIIGASFATERIGRRYDEIFADTGRKTAYCIGGGGQAPWNGPTVEVEVVDDERDGHRGVSMFFTQIAGNSLFTRTHGFMFGLSVDELLNSSGVGASLFARNEHRRAKWRVEFGNWVQGPSRPGNFQVKISGPGVSPESSSGVSYLSCRPRTPRGSGSADSSGPERKPSEGSATSESAK